MSSTKRLLRAAALVDIIFEGPARRICPTCALSRGLARPTATSKSTSRRIQASNASTHASSTAINAQSRVPAGYEKLYRSLEQLKRHAPNYVNISRLGLALRGLESSHPTIRLAVLGLQDTKSARRLARLLLTDVLSDQSEWEEQLKALPDDDARGLLLRYGDGLPSLSSSSLVTTINIPSRILQEHNLEILISSLNINAGLPDGPIDTTELRRTAMVPTAETPKSFTGNVSFITYPVHRAIVVADGMQGCLALGRYAMPKTVELDGSLGAIKLAVNLAGFLREQSVGSSAVSDIAVIDVASGTEAINKFRETNANAMMYERQWHQSGVSELSSWLAQSYKSASVKQPHPAVLGLVHDLVFETVRQIDLEDRSRQQQLARPATSDTARQPLEEALQIWAMRAHSELRDELESAFSSTEWSKLIWWKLLWRVDDVTMIMSELLQRKWLVDAEKGMIWLSGRAVEAGLDLEARSLSSQPDGPSTGPTNKSQSDRTANSEVACELAGTHWPPLIPNARKAISRATVPMLQSMAQTLLIQTISVSTLTTALSALIYISLPTASVYSTGAVAALGLVWSLRHLQKKWERARQTWARDVREAGRVILKQMEETYRAILTSRVGVREDVATQDRRTARLAVEMVQKSLRDLTKRS